MGILIYVFKNFFTVAISNARKTFDILTQFQKDFSTVMSLKAKPELTTTAFWLLLKKVNLQ